MSGVALVNPKIPFYDALGAPLVGGTLDVYLAGTTTRTNTWQDRAQTTLNTNPLVLDARGECTLWADDTLTYKFVLKNAAGVQQWAEDNISGANVAGSLVTFQQSGTGSVQRTMLAKAREVFSVKDFGAVGDGVTDDTSKIQAATDAIGAAGGGTLYFPPGTYYIDGATHLRIEYDDVQWVGCGPASEIYIANWQLTTNPVSNGHLRIAKTTAAAISGVRIHGLKFRGTKDYLLDHSWYGASLPWNCIVFGNSAAQTFDNCGVDYCTFEKTGGSCIGLQSGSNDNAVDASVSKGFFVRHNYMDNGIFSGVDVYSGGVRDADISHNTIRKRSGGGILYSGTSGLIDNNRIEYTANYGIAAAGYSTKGNWTHVTNNKLFRCGFGVQGGSAMSPSMYFGDAAINNFLFIDGNTVTDAYGQGIYISGSSQDVVIQNCRIQGFGYEGNSGGKTLAVPGSGWIGIESFNSTRVVIKGCSVQSLSGASDRSDYGIALGGGSAADCFADDNTTIGTFLTAPFFFSTVHGGATARTGVRLGRNNNFDVYTLQWAQILNQLNAETIPSFTSGDTTPSIAGSPVWFTANAGATTITALDGGNVGQEVTIIFQDANTTIADGGMFSLNGAISPSAVNLTLTLVRGTTGTWFEKARVQS